jgi:hypothetical protein
MFQRSLVFSVLYDAPQSNPQSPCIIITCFKHTIGTSKREPTHIKYLLNRSAPFQSKVINLLLQSFPQTDSTTVALHTCVQQTTNDINRDTWVKRRARPPQKGTPATPSSIWQVRTGLTIKPTTSRFCGKKLWWENQSALEEASKKNSHFTSFQYGRG